MARSDLPGQREAAGLDSRPLLPMSLSPFRQPVNSAPNVIYTLVGIYLTRSQFPRIFCPAKCLACVRIPGTGPLLLSHVGAFKVALVALSSCKFLSRPPGLRWEAYFSLPHPLCRVSFPVFALVPGVVGAELCCRAGLAFTSVWKDWIWLLVDVSRSFDGWVHVNGGGKWLAGRAGRERRAALLPSLKGLEISADIDSPSFSTSILRLPFSLSLPLSSNNLVALKTTSVFREAYSLLEEI